MILNVLGYPIRAVRRGSSRKADEPGKVLQAAIREYGYDRLDISESDEVVQ